MKDQYFLKDKKAQIYRDLAGEMDPDGFRGDSCYVPLGKSPLWCYTRQTSMEFRQYALSVGKDERRFFVFNHLDGVGEGDYILYRDQWYEITRVDTADDYRGDMFIYAALGLHDGTPPDASRFLPYGTPAGP